MSLHFPIGWYAKRKEQVIKKKIDESYELLATEDHIYIKHLDDVIKDVTALSGEEILKDLNEMKRITKENFNF